MRSLLAGLLFASLSIHAARVPWVDSEFHGTPAPPPATQIQRIRQFYEKVFTRLYDNTAVRVRDLEQLEQLAGRYGTAADEQCVVR